MTSPEKVSGSVSLADSTSWCISAHDKNAIEIVSYLRKIMELQHPSNKHNRQLIVFTNSQTSIKEKLIPPPFIKQFTGHLPETRFCAVDNFTNMNMLALQLMKIASIMRQESEKKMGFLIHGALAEHEGNGVILAGPGGIGKTTISNLLPEAWNSLCDDATLIVRNQEGSYMAHPWPTWSKFMFGDSGGTWNVSKNFPVAGVYFLKRGNVEKSSEIKREEAICRLVRSAEEALIPIASRDDEYDSNDMRINRFNNICAFSEFIPSYTLSFTQNGTFWKEIEKDISRN
ncbi:SynChlorMet cassette protein ScmC [Thermodesulfobacteriota bacterium]